MMMNLGVLNNYADNFLILVCITRGFDPRGLTGSRKRCVLYVSINSIVNIDLTAVFSMEALVLM